MKNKKNIILISTLLLALILLGIGSVAYYRRTVNGDLTGNTGNLVLIVNEANAVRNESFSVSLNRSEEEPFVMPDDRGMFNLNIDSTGSSTDVAVTITFSRNNLPNNLKFYLDEECTQEFISQMYKINKSNNMTMTVPVYWFWDGSVDNVDDTLYMDKAISADVIVSATLYRELTLYETLLSKNPTLDTDVDFSVGVTEDNGSGLMMREGTQTQEYPVVYYRGMVKDNVVKYAGYCWLIVKTTETGGVKLIYNGIPNDNGTCKNYLVTDVKKVFEVFLNFSPYAQFNLSSKSPVYAGYMYNDADTYLSSDILDASGYTAHLANNAIDQTTGRHIQNLKDSNAKTLIDTWYEANIVGKPEESLLEDTVWCNDRSTSDTAYSINNYNTGYTITLGSDSIVLNLFLYKNMFYKNIAIAWNRQFDLEIIDESVLTDEIYEQCERNVDKFTVDSANGNGDLDYPIGLLTASEILLAGVASMYEEYPVPSYLGTNMYGFYSMTPILFFRGDISVLGVYDDGNLDISNVTGNGSGGVRPAISLKNDVVVTQGSGTYTDPYVVS